MKKSTKHRTFGAFKNFYIGLVFLFLYLPIGVVIFFSFNTSKMNIVFEGFTGSWYLSMFENRILMDSLVNTLIVAFFTTLIATVIGTIGAVGMSKYRFFGKNLLDKLLYIPVVVPEIVIGIALLSTYTAMQIPLGLTTMILSHVTFCIPFVVISVRARLSGMDKAYEEASMDLGANRIKTFIKVILPMLMPGVVSGAILSFSLSLDDVIISFFTSGPGSSTLPLTVFSMVRMGVTPEVNALFSVIMVFTILIILINTYFQSKKLHKKA